MTAPLRARRVGSPLFVGIEERKLTFKGGTTGAGGGGGVMGPRPMPKACPNDKKTTSAIRSGITLLPAAFLLFNFLCMMSLHIYDGHSVQINIKQKDCKYHTNDICRQNVPKKGTNREIPLQFWGSITAWAIFFQPQPPKYGKQ
jgi:hypothetical protein